MTWEGVIMASRQLVIFNINDESFGVEITQVKEIIKPMDIFKVPNTPDFIEGLINLRGKVHTVFNLRKRFNLPSKALDDSTKIIIVNVNSMMVGFIVDEVNEIVRIEDESIENAPKVITSLNRKYISGVAKIGERIILLLDLSLVLTVEEEAELKCMVK
jgi:purine-binding chemotaxis protein CheW